MTNAQELWDQVKALLKGCNEETLYKTIFEPIDKIHKFVDGKIFLIVENNLTKFRIEKFYLSKMNELLSQCTNENISFQLITKEMADAEFKEYKKDDQNKPASSSVISKRILRAEYTFENFITGEANREAFTFAVRVAESPNVTINPFYIFGDVGLGKTHLMTAIGHYILCNKPDCNVVYTTAQQFVEDYFKSKNKNQKNTQIADEFDNYYRSADLLLIDDIQYLADRQGSQDEFFKLFEYLFERNKQIIVTSDRPANELNIMARLKSRFSWGIQTDIKKPNLELRKNIIKNKLKTLITDPESVTDEVITFIAENFDSNVRELEGALRRFISYCVAFNINYTIENAKIALEPIISSDKDKVEKNSATHIEKIKECIASYYNINVKDLSSTTRKQEIVYARSMTVYILKTKYNLTLAKIGQSLGNRDHATIAHAFEKIQEALQNDENVRQDLNNLIKSLDKLYN